MVQWLRRDRVPGPAATCPGHRALKDKRGTSQGAWQCRIKLSMAVCLQGGYGRGGWEPEVKVPAARGEAPVSVSTSALVLRVLEDGGVWGRAIPTALQIEEQYPQICQNCSGRCVTVVLISLLSCFPVSSPEPLPSAAGAVPVP